jgi:hypothetical protein
MVPRRILTPYPGGRILPLPWWGSLPFYPEMLRGVLVPRPHQRERTPGFPGLPYSIGSAPPRCISQAPFSRGVTMTVTIDPSW